ncbi:RNA polymerase sigma-70 factor [Prolixibacteraceae bacterium JC049]|nr:RNA polymerase sigma-70 factor [Prolixibacteraceae bacterium JC049]
MKKSDSELLQLYSKGNVLAFNELFTRYYQVLCVYACRLGIEKGVAEDVVQDVFMVIWEKREKIQIVSSLKSYLFNSVRNKVYNISNRDKVKSDVLHQVQYNHETGKYFDQVESNEFSAILFQCIDDLPPRCREVFQLSRLENERQMTIAEKLGISINTVKGQMGKALSFIRTCLDDKYKIAY